MAKRRRTIVEKPWKGHTIEEQRAIELLGAAFGRLIYLNDPLSVEVGEDA